MILLDGKVNTDLNWIEARQQALATEKNLVWKMDLGLFKNLKHSLSHKSQHMSLRLSLDHFRDGLWREFQERTEKVVLYKGCLDFSRDFIWDLEQEKNFHLWKEETQLESSSLFCGDVLADYLHLLTQGFDMPFFVILDAASIKDPAWEAALANRERFGDIQVEVLNSNLNLDEKAKIAICFPSTQKILPGNLTEVVRTFVKEARSFRIIPEAYLLNEWSGLDELIVDANSVDQQLKRKLQGFEAAGGLVILV